MELKEFTARVVEFLKQLELAEEQKKVINHKKYTAHGIQSLYSILSNEGVDVLDRGRVLYLGMGKIKETDRTVVLSIGYTPEYAIKKAIQFEDDDDNVKFTDVNVVITGELKKSFSFYVGKELYAKLS